MNHLALFNGIGGFQLAADWCGWNNIAHVEIDDFCNKVVAQHFPNSVCHTDIKDFDGKQYAGSVDIISGGFPCQPYSVAGLRRGKEDDRALWPEMLRVISEVRPDWVVGENVAGILSMGINNYVSDLEAEGYDVQCFGIPACAVNAPHKRERVWILAHSERERGRGGVDSRKDAVHADSCGKTFRHARYASWWSVEPELGRVANGIPDRLVRLKALGNAIVPQVAYEIFKAINTIENERQIHQ